VDNENSFHSGPARRQLCIYVTIPECSW